MPDEYKYKPTPAPESDGLFALGNARATDPDTSHAAAAMSRLGRNKLMFELLSSFSSGGHEGITDESAYERISSRFPKAKRSWWKRCSDLRQFGFIEPTGKKSRTETGAMARVCRVTPVGMAALIEILSKDRT